MRMGRIEFAVAVLASALVTVTGLYLGLTRAGTEAGTFGWVIAVVGGAALIANLVLRTRLR
jgi:hypothetical protein